ncbi:hypothetical protein GCM10022286_08580 [Gryllotalpicola daejeonensis]|uniref:Uncharacterized protein n=1 Tax=Gryllotalpicola daejeonensis TaxID=993087 RepID=A0ABP7ZGM6_9MICO
MAKIYDETALEAGHGQRFSLGELQLHINRTPAGDWMVDAGGTDVVKIRPAQGGGFFVDAGAAPAYRSAFPSAMQLALRRLNF